MATVPVPRTWVTGEVVTAAYMNANVRDAVNYLIAPPLCVAKQTSAQSLANATSTAITLDAEDKDSDGMHSNSVNPSRLTAVTAGWYSAQTTINFAANATGLRLATFYINGSEVGRRTEITNGGAVFSTAISTAGTMYLAVGDYLESRAWQNSGGSLNTAPAGTDLPYLQARWVST